MLLRIIYQGIPFCHDCGIVVRMDGLLTTYQAASLTGFSHTHVCRLCRTGKLPAIRFGHAWMIAEQDAVKLLEEKAPRISRDELDDLYWKQEFSITDISNVTGISRMAIYRLMVRFGIPRRDVSAHLFGPQNPLRNLSAASRQRWLDRPRPTRRKGARSSIFRQKNVSDVASSCLSSRKSCGKTAHLALRNGKRNKGNLTQGKTAGAGMVARKTTADRTGSSNVSKPERVTILLASAAGSPSVNWGKNLTFIISCPIRNSPTTRRPIVSPT